MLDLSESVATACAHQLSFIPGISSYSVGVSMEPDFDEIAALGVQWIEPLLKPGKTLKFCVRTRRSV